MDLKELLGHQYLPDEEDGVITYLSQTITTYGYLWALYEAITYGIILGNAAKTSMLVKQKGERKR